MRLPVGLAHRLSAAALMAWFAAAGPASQVRGWPSQSPPKPLQARDVSFPPYELRTLPNGLQVVVVRHTEQPAVTLRMIVRAGAAQDPDGRPGVAAMVATLLDQGTSTRSAREVADTIDSAGGSLEAGLGRDLSFIDVIMMKDSLRLAMGLLADVARRPAFADEEIERQRKQVLSALQVSFEDPEFVADLVFERLVYGFSPYGHPGNGTPDSVRSITRDDLQAFHRRHFAPNNTLLAVVGDVTAEEAFAEIEQAFGDWPRQEIPAAPAGESPPPTRRLVVVDKPDAVQTEVRVGHLGLRRTHKDFTAMDLAVRILGGEGANRVQQVLRMQRGLTYGASADMEAFTRGGHYVVRTNTRTDATAEVLRLIVDEYSRLRRERVEDRELSDAKAYLTGNFPLTLETPADIATHVLNQLFYELPLEELQTFRKRVNAVGVGDVGRVAWEYLRPDRLSVVLVGNLSAFARDLRGVGLGQVERVPLAELDLTAADFKKR